MITVAIITVSDRSAKGARDDLSGPEIKKWAIEKKYEVKAEATVPDEQRDIEEKLIKFSDAGYNIIFTTGGTGFALRDVTPEATRAVIEREAPGFAETARAKSLEITPHAMLSRAVSGIRKQTIIINLPGSPKAVRENLGFIEKAIPHAVELLNGSVVDCGSE